VINDIRWNLSRTLQFISRCRQNSEEIQAQNADHSDSSYFQNGFMGADSAEDEFKEVDVMNKSVAITVLNDVIASLVNIQIQDI
jgi:hypothetical protein